jgi:hypothetical protein
MRLYLTALLLVAMATPAVAYDLRPSKVAKILKDETHELFSIASFECMKARQAAEPDVTAWNCLPDHMNFAYDYANDHWVPSLRGWAIKDDDLKVQYLLAGVRWPDDPMGLARSNNPIRLIGNFQRCESWLAGSYGPCANRFCLSHFGHLQMAHSMKSSAPWCEGKKPRYPHSSTCGILGKDPKSAIEAWVRWLIAIGKEKVDISTAVVKDPFAKTIFDQQCPEVYQPEFTYQRLFFSDCSKNPWYQFWNWGKKCRVVNPAKPEAELKLLAVGAILHVIQDSYARGHTVRVAMGGSSWCAPRISCTKISKFSSYNEQDPDKHGVADHTPIWDTSCFKPDRCVDDPITAGAKVLAMFESSEHTEEDIWKYLSNKVFSVSNDSLTKDQLKDEQACFGRN